MTDLSKIHLVTPDEPKATDPQHPNTRLSLGEYFADIINNREQDCAYWIIQKIGSSDIVDWGRASDFRAAKAAAHRNLEALVQSDTHLGRRG